jgi:hypothetical protein
MKAFRFAFVFASVVALASACSGGSSSSSPVGGDDDDDDGSFKLSNGHYAFTIDNVPADNCWAPPKTLPTLPLVITGTYTVVGNDVTIVTDASGSIPSQTLNLVKDGNNLTGGGTGLADLNEQGINCILDVAGDFTGVMTAEDKFDATMVIDVAQSSGDCSLLVGSFLPEQVDQLPCDLELEGAGEKG